MTVYLIDGSVHKIFAIIVVRSGVHIAPRRCTRKKRGREWARRGVRTAALSPVSAGKVHHRGVPRERVRFQFVDFSRSAARASDAPPGEGRGLRVMVVGPVVGRWRLVFFLRTGDYFSHAKRAAKHIQRKLNNIYIHIFVGTSNCVVGQFFSVRSIARIISIKSYVLRSWNFVERSCHSS